jgi:hypothetical protein
VEILRKFSFQSLTLDATGFEASVPKGGVLLPGDMVMTAFKTANPQSKNFTILDSSKAHQKNTHVNTYQNK